MNVGILGLQGDVSLHESAVRRCGHEPTRVRSVSDLDGVEALILPGGESTTLSRLLRLSGLDKEIQSRAQKGMPIYGTCAGLILLSQGKPDREGAVRMGLLELEVARNAYGSQVHSFETDIEIPWDKEAPFRAVFIRAPVVEKLGENVEVIASCNGHPALIRQGRVLASSFHPELTDDPRIHNYFFDKVC